MKQVADMTLDELDAEYEAVERTITDERSKRSEVVRAGFRRQRVEYNIARIVTDQMLKEDADGEAQG